MIVILFIYKIMPKYQVEVDEQRWIEVSSTNKNTHEKFKNPEELQCMVIYFFNAKVIIIESQLIAKL